MDNTITFQIETMCSRLRAQNNPSARVVIAPKFKGMTTQQENKHTLHYFTSVFGKERMAEIFQRCAIDTEEIIRNGLTGRHVEQIYLNLAIISKTNLEVLFNQIQAIPDGKRLNYLPFEEVGRLKQLFHGKKFEDLNKSDLDALYNAAVPFQKIEMIFIYGSTDSLGLPKMSKTARAVYYTEKFRRGEVTIKEQDLFEYYKLKCIVRYNSIEGLVIPEVEGYRYLTAKHSDEGINLAIFEPLAGTRSDNYHTQLLCLATQMPCDGGAPNWFETMQEDVRERQGEKGVLKTIDWVNANIGEGLFDIAGYSLGATQAQRFVGKFNRCHHLVASCGPRIDADSVREFNEAVRSRPLEMPEMKVSYITNYLDRISFFGDTYAGDGLDRSEIDIRLRMIRPASQEEVDLDQQLSKGYQSGDRATLENMTRELESEVGDLDNMKRIKDSLFGAHMDNYLLENPIITDIEMEEGQDGAMPSSLMKGIVSFEQLRKNFGNCTVLVMENAENSIAGALSNFAVLSQASFAY